MVWKTFDKFVAVLRRLGCQALLNLQPHEIIKRVCRTIWSGCCLILSGPMNEFRSLRVILPGINLEQILKQITNNRASRLVRYQFFQFGFRLFILLFSYQTFCQSQPRHCYNAERAVFRFFEDCPEGVSGFFESALLQRDLTLE